MSMRERVTNEINATYGANAEWIMKWLGMDMRSLDFIENHSGRELAEYCANNILKKADEYNEERLSPVTAKVGDGVTVCLWSDRHAATIIKRTATTITLQYDKATIDPDFKPEFIVGGFAAHCTNQEEQSYTYERNPEGAIETYRWSKKNARYQGGGDGSIKVIKGRHEFYDYNF